MKPAVKTLDQSKRRDVFAPRQDRRIPITDCNYHTVALGGYNGARSVKSSFRKISSDYFKSEARHDFLAEASFFAAIVLTAAVPLVSGAYVLMQFIR